MLLDLRADIEAKSKSGPVSVEHITLSLTIVQGGQYCSDGGMLLWPSIHGAAASGAEGRCQCHQQVHSKCVIYFRCSCCSLVFFSLSDTHFIRCSSGWNAMFDAATNGDESVVRLLLASKANINQKAPRYVLFSELLH
jgi:hypothetical protein